jgi:transposase-like protein
MEASDLNQWEYCEAKGIPLKAFGNWPAKFQAGPQPPERKSRSGGPIVPPPRERDRRQFSEAGKRWILEEAAQAGASVAELARRYGIDRRVLSVSMEAYAMPGCAIRLRSKMSITAPRAVSIAHYSKSSLRADGSMPMRT